MAAPNQSVPDALRNYPLWSQLTRVRHWEMTQMRNEVRYLDYRPRVSILMPVYDPKRAWLEAALDSVLSQTYRHWELCVCNDGSSEAYVTDILSLYERLDERVRVRHLDSNAGIAKATNAALSLATGEFVAPIDHDDTVAPHALFEIVKLLQSHPDADLIYTDEDKTNEAGDVLDPHFKPGWSPDMALCLNYLVHLSVYRRSLLEELGGWREGFDGAQDLDLMLRYTEKTNRIHRLPKVLYHWRMGEGSVATRTSFKPYTHERARLAIADALERRGVRGRVLDGFMPNVFRVEREIAGRPKVSVLIPLREGVDHSRCMASLETQTTYPELDVRLLTTEGAFRTTRAPSTGASVVEVPSGSTPLKMYNAAIRQVEGEYILFLDPNLEALSEGWLEALLQHAQRAEVGAVGGKLVSEDGDTLQAGLILDPEEREEPPPAFYRPFNRWLPGLMVFVEQTRNCSAVSGACMMVRKEVLGAAGGFDAEHLEDTFGDVDLCLRLIERDLRIVYTPHAEFVSHGLAPASGLKQREVSYVRERWGGLLDDDPYYNPNLRSSTSDLQSVLSLLGLGDRRLRATKRRMAAEPSAG